MEISVYFKENLRLLRKAKGLSQAELGKLVGKTYNAIHSWEAGLTEPKLKDIFVLSYYFDIPVDVFLYKDITQTTYIQSLK